jgi:cation diffusion facilitator family transporter
MEKPRCVTEKINHAEIKIKAIKISVSVSFILMSCKFAAYFLTGSIAVLSDALESIINVVASVFALYAVHLASKSPDEDHPYGHGKVEYFSAGFEGSLILLTSLLILYEGIEHFLNPKLLPNLGYGFILLIVSAIGNWLLGWYLIKLGKKTNSITLVADGKHVSVDVITTISVLCGLGLIYFTNILRLDGFIACLAAGYIFYSGAHITKESISGLMDEKEDEIIEQLCCILNYHKVDYWIGVHRLRCWTSGSKKHIDFHLILPRHTDLIDAHDIVMELREVLQASIPDVEDVMIHIDYCRDTECVKCFQDLCKSRVYDLSDNSDWDCEEMILDRDK